MRTGIPKSAWKVLHSSSRALAIDQIFEAEAAVEEQVLRFDVGARRRSRGHLRVAIEAAADARAEKLRYVRLDPELTGRHR